MYNAGEIRSTIMAPKHVEESGQRLAPEGLKKEMKERQQVRNKTKKRV